MENLIKKRGNKLYVKWKDYDNSFHSWIVIQYFPKSHKPFGGHINVKVDLSTHATKTDFKKATGIVMPELAAKSDLV